MEENSRYVSTQSDQREFINFTFFFLHKICNADFTDETSIYLIEIVYNQPQCLPARIYSKYFSLSPPSKQFSAARFLFMYLPRFIDCCRWKRFSPFHGRRQFSFICAFFFCGHDRNLMYYSVVSVVQQHQRKGKTGKTVLARYLLYWMRHYLKNFNYVVP